MRTHLIERTLILLLLLVRGLEYREWRQLKTYSKDVWYPTSEHLYKVSYGSYDVSGQDSSRLGWNKRDGDAHFHWIWRVSASISRRHKHLLPISDDCPWRNIAHLENGNFTTGSRPITSYEDLWTSVHKTSCTLTDDRLQMAILRDPRPTVVSSYFHQKRFGHMELVDGQTLDEYVVSNAPRIAQAISLRYILFGALMKNTSALFWYETTHSSPVQWHEQWLAFMGFDLPPSIIRTAAENAVSRRVNLNGHPGGGDAVVGRSFRDELRPDVADKVDKIVQKMLPQIMLERFEIPFQ